MKVYGIKSCDSVKKATTFLRENNITFDFHDYKTQGITEEVLKNWISQVGYEILVNKKGTTWKQLDEPIKSSVIDENSAIELMKAKTSVIKRPVIEKDGKVVAVGFNESEYTKNLL